MQPRPPENRQPRFRNGNYVGAAEKKRCQGFDYQGENEEKQNGCGEKGQVLQEVASGQTV
jgi:hypothetical protein